MRMLKSFLSATVAASLIATPALAGSDSLSIGAAQRDASPVGKEEAFFGIPIFIGLALLVAVIAVVVVADDEDEPTSP
jgi:UDP-N-acetylmuramyl pentapeptide phosphotransferase/UDP-N-acetylglucosamine-1-phosphate transferase